MTIWDQCIRQITQHTAAKRRVAIKASPPTAAGVLDGVFEVAGLADLPAPAGGLVPPTLATGIPGLGPVLGSDLIWLDLIQTVAHTPRIQTLPEFRRVVSEWMQRHQADLPPEATLKGLLGALIDMNEQQWLAQQKKARDDRRRQAAGGNQDDTWMNPLASHRFGRPLQTAQSDDTGSRATECENLRAWLGQPQGLHRVRAVLFVNLLCVHLSVRPDAPSDCTPAVVGLLMRTATRLLQAIALHTDDEVLGDNAAAIATELSRQSADGAGFPAIGATPRAAGAAASLPRPFRPGWVAAPDSLLLTARHALDPQHHTWLEATAWLARDTAGLVTCGLLAPQLQLLGADDHASLLDGLLLHLHGQKEALRRPNRRALDSSDPFLQMLSKPMYLHRLWQHLQFLARARHALCTAARRLPRSKLADKPANLIG